MDSSKLGKEIQPAQRTADGNKVKNSFPERKRNLNKTKADFYLISF